MKSPTPRNRGRGERRIEVKAWALTYQFDGGTRMLFVTDIASKRQSVIKKLAPKGDWQEWRSAGYRVERVTITTEAK